MTSIYLAGKVGMNDWRHSVVPGLRGALEWLEQSPSGAYPAWDAAYVGAGLGWQDWPILSKAVVGSFDYTGPYFVHCDHGCWHGDGGHGFSPSGCGEGQIVGNHCYTASDAARWYVYQQSLRAISTSDIVYAHIEDETAYGTLFELGYAAALGKQIVISQTSDYSANLWFPYSSGKPARGTPEEILRRLASDIIEPEFDSPMERLFWQTARSSLNWDRVFRGKMTSQEPVGRYRLDFAFPEVKLAIEIDGFDYHSTKDQLINDHRRQREIERAGWRVIRFAGSEIYRDPEQCVQEVVLAVRGAEPVSSS